MQEFILFEPFLILPKDARSGTVRRPRSGDTRSSSRSRSVAVSSEKPTASERCCVETIIDALVDLPSPALKARLAATESALAAAKSEREEAAKRLETAKAKHRDLLNPQVVYSRLAGTRNIETRSKLRLEIRRRVEPDKV
jgi:hypothetical protein